MQIQSLSQWHAACTVTIPLCVTAAVTPGMHAALCYAETVCVLVSRLASLTVHQQLCLLSTSHYEICTHLLHCLVQELPLGQKLKSSRLQESLCSAAKHQVSSNARNSDWEKGCTALATVRTACCMHAILFAPQHTLVVHNIM